VTVVFPDKDVFADEAATILLVEDSSKLEISLKASPPSPAVDCSGDVNFGRVVADGRMHAQTLHLQNHGQRPAKFAIVPEDQADLEALPFAIEIRPTAGEIAREGDPGDAQEIFIGVSSLKAFDTDFSVPYLIVVDGQPEPARFCVSTTLVGHVLKVVPVHEAGGDALELLDIGCIHYSTARVTTAMLVNDGPEPVVFSLTPSGFDCYVETPGGGRQLEYNKYEGDYDFGELPVSISPNHGEIGPHERVAINFEFAPVAAHPSAGWQKEYAAPPRRDYNVWVRAMAIGNDLVHNFELSGSAMAPKFEISNTTIQFPDCEVGQSSSETISVKNESAQLPLAIETDQIAHFTMAPSNALVLPGDEVTFTIDFIPNQAGPLTTDFTLHFANRTVNVPLKLQGTCSANAVGLQRSRKFGLATLKRQLKTKVVFRFGFTAVTSMKAQYISGPDGRQTHGVHATANPNHKLKSIAPNGRPYVAMDPTITLDMNATQKRSAERRKYDGYIKELGKTRRERVLSRIRNSPKSINSTGGIGRAPEPLVPRPKVVSRAEEREAAIRAKSKVVVITTVPLSPTQLCKVGPTKHRIDFGDVCQGSSNVVDLKLRNSLSQDVEIRLQPRSRELSETSDAPVVIPAHSSVEVQVILSGIGKSTPQNYNTDLAYVVNGHHLANIVTTAHIVPPKLLISTDTVNIPVKASAQCELFAKSFTLSNPLGHAAKFRWVIEGGEAREAEHFSVVPQEGTVDPHGSLDCVAQLSPSALMPDSAVFTLHVEDSSEVQSLRTCVKSKKPKCQMDNSLLLFGQIAINQPTLLEATLTNTGNIDAYFSVGDMSFRPHSTTALEVQPRYGCVRAGESVNLQCSYTPTIMCKFDGNFKVNIRDAAPLKVLISGTGINPEVDLTAPEFFFSKVPCGTTVYRPFTLVNKGKSRVTMSFDLRDQRDFEIYYPQNDGDGTEPNRAQVYDSDLIYEDEAGLTPARKTVQDLAWKANSMRTFLQHAQLSASLRRPYETELEAVQAKLGLARTSIGLDEVDVTPKGCAFCVEVEGEATLPLLLRFAPRDVAAYDFELPLSINGLPYGSRRVRGTAARMSLQLSERKFDFGNYFLTDTDTPTSLDRTLSVHWIGAAKEAIFFTLCGDATMSDAFSVGFKGDDSTSLVPNTPCRIDLDAGETKDLVISFLPTSTEVYSAMLCVYIGSPDGVFVADIALSGCCTQPFVAFDTLYVDLPSVPIGVESSVTFNVTANGYPAGEHEVLWKIPEQTASFPVKISFPKGAKFQGPSTTMPVTASFTATGPISFDAAVDFGDAFGGSFPLRVTGRADSSLLTLYPFIATHPDAYVVTTAKQLDPAAYLVSMTRAVKRWFSTFGLPTQVPIDVPETLTADCGRAIFDIIKKQSGHDVPGLTLMRPDRTTPGKMLHTLSLMLKDLTTHGAFLSHIRPQLLLPREDFVSWKKGQVQTQYEAGLSQLPEGKRWIEHYAWVEQNYTALTTAAWTAVCTQILRVFALNYITEERVTARCGGALPMVEEPIVQQIHCREEQLLLLWLTHLHQTVTGSSITVSNFGDDLADGRVLASVLVAHVPPLAQVYFSDLFVLAGSEAQRRHNASRVISAVSAIGLDEFVVDWSDITAPNPSFMMLYVSFLFRSLAQYAIPDEKIVFTSELHKKVSRMITISNTSSQSLTYRVRIDGTDQFSSKSSITVAKHSQKSLEVECIPRFYDSAEAILLLTGKPSGSARGSVLIFRLETDVLQTTDKPAITFDATCYSLTHIDIPLKNTLDRAGTFKLSTMLVAAPKAPGAGGATRRGKGKGSASKKVTRRSIAKSAVQTRHGHKENNRTFVWALVDEVELEAGQTKAVRCCVCPTRLGQHRAVLLATHQELGQLQVLIGGAVKLPKAVERLNFACDVGDDIAKTIKIPYVNKLKLNAIQEIPGGLDDSTLTKSLTLAESAGKLLSEEVLLDVNVRSPVSESGGRVPLDLPERINLMPGVPCKTGTLLATHISASQLVRFKEKTDMQLRLNPLQQGKFECDMVLTGPDDIRVYKVHIAVNNTSGGDVARPPVERAIFCKRNAVHMEDFEVTNNSPQEAVFQVSTELENGLATADEAPITVPAGATHLYRLKLHPRTGSGSSGQGFLTFVSGDQHTTYKLLIWVEEDEAAPVLPVLCGAVDLSASNEEAVQMSIALQNPFEVPVEFQCIAEGPCADELLYEPSVRMAALSTVDYTVTFQPTGQDYAKTVDTLRLRAVDHGAVVAEYQYTLNTETLGWKPEWELTLQSLLKRTGVEREAAVKALIGANGVGSNAEKLLPSSA